MTAPVGQPAPSTWIRAYAQIQVASDAQIAAILADAQSSIAADMARIAGSSTVSDRIRYEQMARTRQAILREQGAAFRRIGNVIEARRVEAAARAIQLGADLDAYIFDRVGRTQLASSLTRSISTGLRRTTQVALARTEFSYTALSQRIYNADVALGSRLDRRITSLLAQGKTAREFAAEAVDWFNPSTPGGVRFAAMRLSRSEINNAFHSVAVQQAQEKPWISSMRWHLSGSHPKPDVCDEYASDDRHHLGPGVFPKEDVPRKPHPQCFCYVTPIQVDEEEFLDGLVSGKYDRYIDEKRQISQSEAATPSMVGPLRSEPGRETFEDAKAYVAGLPVDVRKSLKQGLDQGRADGTLHPFDLQIHHALGGRKPTAVEMARATEFRRVALARKAAMDAEAAARRAIKSTAKTAPPKVRTPPPPKAQPIPKPPPKPTKATTSAGPTQIQVSGHRVAVSSLTDDMARRVAGRLEHQHDLVPGAVGQLRRVKGSAKRMKVMGDTRGARGTYERQTRTITLHHDVFDDRHLHLPSARPGWTGRYRDSAETILDHEFGHHLHSLLKASGREQEVWDVISSSMGLPSVDHRDFIAMSDWMAAHRSVLRTQVSTYGSTAETELMAEIWAEYSGGDIARPHIKRIGDRIRQILESS